ncbi:VOC family protein [Jeotgalibacillus proteolyticus]|uniref:Glyoxalase/bleomycin resistance/extradiol dioxygenase family protein n=1 Tax=Jeotgalibacillus proteolyticus TaxID=2082395 RepID=A0A2S5GC06_9BACL|nr:VOC family protein [Jeotgalibacillus proteolyticus]PPA70562.1 glyoxalase/bleomycin resistance/extradiol dioxygenase family protein [Jeotgalibacillus proteolyticus]
MISKLGQVMLYVNDQDSAVAFWTEHMGFIVKAESSPGDMRWIEIAPSNGEGTSIVLQDKKFIQQMEPELNVETPSLMFFTEALDDLYSGMTEKGITVGEIVEMGGDRIFNFADHEENYFAVMEKRN